MAMTATEKAARAALKKEMRARERASRLASQAIISLFFERSVEKAIHEPVHPAAALVMAAIGENGLGRGEDDIIYENLVQLSLRPAFDRSEAAKVVLYGLEHLVGMKMMSRKETKEGGFRYKLLEKGKKYWSAAEKHLMDADSAKFSPAAVAVTKKLVAKKAAPAKKTAAKVK